MSPSLGSAADESDRRCPAESQVPGGNRRGCGSSGGRYRRRIHASQRQSRRAIEQHQQALYSRQAALAGILGKVGVYLGGRVNAGKLEDAELGVKAATIELETGDGAGRQSSLTS